MPARLRSLAVAATLAVIVRDAKGPRVKDTDMKQPSSTKSERLPERNRVFYPVLYLFGGTGNRLALGTRNGMLRLSRAGGDGGTGVFSRVVWEQRGLAVSITSTFT